MSADALQRLLGLRVAAVEQARVRVLAAQRAYEAADSAQRAALRDRQERERALQTSRVEFVAAETVFALRLADAHGRSCAADLARANERVGRCESARVHADQQRQALQRALREAELARRVVERSLERRQLDVSRRTEQRAEDELDDATRAAASRRASHPR